MNIRRKQWLFYCLVLVVGLALGIVITQKGMRIFPGKGLTADREQAPLGVEAAPRVSEEVRSLQASLSAVAQHVMPAVVNIASVRVYRTPGGGGGGTPFFNDPFFRDFFGDDADRFFGVPRERVERSLGSGVLVAEDGYIITNNHVISQSTQVTVSLADKREFKAKVVGADPKTDVAILKIDGKGFPTITLGNSDKTRIGDIVLAVGNPFGIGQTITMGIISAKGRSQMGIVDYEDFIQTDAAINPGNSGGALVNIEGDVIGINTAIVSRTGGYQGIGFAIPSNIAKAVMTSLVKHGKMIRGWLGVSLQEVTPQIAAEFGLPKPEGALIVEVMANSPAAKAGLRRGDIILNYGDKKIEQSGELRILVADTPVNDKVSLTIWRDRQNKEVPIVIKELRS
jgi:serine protease Do